MFCKFLFPSCELSDVIMTLSANSIFIVTGKSFTSCTLGKFQFLTVLISSFTNLPPSPLSEKVHGKFNSFVQEFLPQGHSRISLYYKNFVLVITISFTINIILYCLNLSREVIQLAQPQVRWYRYNWKSDRRILQNWKQYLIF